MVKQNLIFEIEDELGIQAIGKTVKCLRERLKLTQEQLSELAKIDKSELFNLENECCKSISSDTLIRICPHLNVSLDYVLASFIPSHDSNRELFYDFAGNEIRYILYTYPKNEQ